MPKIPTYPALTTPSNNDLLVIEDTVSSSTKKITREDFLGAPFSVSDLTVDTLTVSNVTTPTGYTALGVTPNTVTYLGNRSYECVFNAIDLTGTLSNGMRLRTTRTVTAPTKCTSLNGTNQYYSKSSPAGMTFTDDFVVGAWVKVSSYKYEPIISRFNGTSGWSLLLNASGQVILIGYNASGSNYSQVMSYQSVPLNKWVHISAQLDMSAFTATTTTSYVMVDGVDVPAAVSRGGTNPTALVQAGNLEVGSENGGSFFSGKIAQAFVSSAKITQANVRTLISQGLTSALISSNNIISAYSFNNTVNDLNTTNANNLTANGSAVATNADSPFTQDDTGTPSGTTDYAIITKKVFSTNTTLTVQVPEGCTIPTSGGVSAVSYSSNKAPYGFPTATTKWRLSSLLKTSNGTTSNATYGSFISGGWQLPTPIGEWNVGWQAGAMYCGNTTEVLFNISPVALTGLSASAGANVSNYGQSIQSPMAAFFTKSSFTVLPQSLTTPATFTMYTIGASTGAGINATTAITEIFAEFAYL